MSDQTGWVEIGTVTTDSGEIAIVAPEIAAVLGDRWCDQAASGDGTPDLAFEETRVAGDATAVTIRTGSDGGYRVFARFADDGYGTMLPAEIRIVAGGE